jgi:hypothetical protein
MQNTAHRKLGAIINKKTKFWHLDQIPTIFTAACQLNRCLLSCAYYANVVIASWVTSSEVSLSTKSPDGANNTNE